MNGFLVLAWCGGKGIPMGLYASRTAARRAGHRLDADDVRERCRILHGDDGDNRAGLVAILEFRDGKPMLLARKDQFFPRGYEDRR
jgi:hypothetical protein